MAENGFLPSKSTAVVSLIGAIIGALLSGFALFQQLAKPIELQISQIDRRIEVLDKIVADKSDQEFLTTVLTAMQNRLNGMEGKLDAKLVDVLSGIRDAHSALNELIRDHEMRLRALENSDIEMLREHEQRLRALEQPQKPR